MALTILQAMKRECLAWKTFHAHLILCLCWSEGFCYVPSVGRLSGFGLSFAA